MSGRGHGEEQREMPELRAFFISDLHMGIKRTGESLSGEVPRGRPEGGSQAPDRVARSTAPTS